MNTDKLMRRYVRALAGMRMKGRYWLAWARRKAAYADAFAKAVYAKR